MIKVYEAQCQTKQQFDQIIGMLCGSMRPNKLTNQAAG